jgi:multicomponent Na+:H+ antiporter subunit B
MITTPEAALLAFVLVSALATAVLRDVLSAIIAFAAYSLGLALLWVFLQAPDVALTEAAIGAGVTSILFLLTITKTVRPVEDLTALKRINWAGVAVVTVLAAVLLSTVPAIPAIGDPNAVAWTYEGVTQYYLDNAYKETGVENVVTAVLASYRGFDTFGEAVVVFGAGVAVLAILREERFT